MRTSLPIVFEDLQTVNTKRSPTNPRSPSGFHRPSALPTLQHTSSTSNVPSPRSASATSKPSSLIPEKSVKKMISIAAFPQPPSSACSSTPGTPIRSPRVSPTEQTTGALSSSARTRGPVRVNTAPAVSNHRPSQTPSLLNETGDGKSIPVTIGPRTSDGSTASPSHSRSSSAQGSCSTTATTFEDTEDAPPRARSGADDGTKGGKTARNKEVKGNVIVSVRVRPETVGSEGSQAEGEWMVDGRKALVAYRGREGGNYIYGRSPSGFSPLSSAHH